MPGSHIPSFPEGIINLGSIHLGIHCLRAKAQNLHPKIPHILLVHTANPRKLELGYRMIRY